MIYYILYIIYYILYYIILYYIILYIIYINSGFIVPPPWLETMARVKFPEVTKANLTRQVRDLQARVSP